MTEPTVSRAEVETRAETMRSPGDFYRYWMREIQNAETTEEVWRKFASSAVDLFRMEQDRDAESLGTKMNIFAANVLTLSPALYSNTPKPDVRRRWRDADPVGKVVADILERGISFQVDQQGDFDEQMDDIVLDHLLTGRGVPWVTYEPLVSNVANPGQAAESAKQAGNEVQAADEAMELEPQQAVIGETLRTECVYWEDFRVSPARGWANVRWVARVKYLSRDELVEQFPECGEKVALDVDTVSRSDNEAPRPDDPFKRAKVYEVWDKASRKVIYLATGYKDGPLMVDDDPLGLRNFFPCPRPLQYLRTTQSMTPIPELRLYQDQARELNDITERISILTQAIKVRGAYDAACQELASLLSDPDGTLVPVKNWAQFMEKGGLVGAVQLMDISGIVAALAQLYQYRAQLVQTIYELTGISDVIRGASDPRETATAQRMKGQFGGLRLTKRQQGVQKLVRELFNIYAEIIGERFSIASLRDVSGLDLPMQADKDAAQAIMQQVAMLQQQAPPPGPQGAQQGAPPIPPELAKQADQAKATLSQPSWEEVVAVMRQDGSRTMRVDVETDSTIAQELNDDKAALMEAIGGFAQLVGSGLPPQLQKALGLAVARRIKLGRVVEDVIDQMPEQAAEGKPDPAAMKAQAEVQKMQAETKAAQERAQIEAQRDQQKAALEAQTAQAEMAIKQQELQLRAAEIAMKQRELAMTAEVAERKHAMTMQQMMAGAMMEPAVEVVTQ